MSKARYLSDGGRSRRADRAEQHGLLPATRAGKALGVPGRFVSDCVLTDEWHHVGAYAAACDYYDVEAIRKALAQPPGQAVLAAWRERQRATRLHKRAPLGDRVANDRLLAAHQCLNDALATAEEAGQDVWVYRVD